MIVFGVFNMILFSFFNDIFFILSDYVIGYYLVQCQLDIWYFYQLDWQSVRGSGINFNRDSYIFVKFGINVEIYVIFNR